MKTTTLKNVFPAKLLAMVLFVFAPLFALKSFAQPVIKFDNTVIKLGTFPKSKIQKATFTFTNTGDKPLVIHQAFSSCGCTVPEYTKEPIAPGKQGKVTVTYNGYSQFPGAFKKPVTIRSNATNSIIRIFIEGDLKDDK